MSSSWGVSLPDHFMFAANMSKSVKYLGISVILVFLLFIIFLMLRSLGFDSKTPPSMVFRKMLVFVKSFYAPILFAKKLESAEELHDNSKLSDALELYLQIFYFEGLTSQRAGIAIHNETVLERIEDIAEETSYDFPNERLDRFQEDLYDYFLVKTKFLAPTDYDGTELHRPENEERFRNKLNLSQEHQLIEGFEHFLTALVSKIQQHIKGGAEVLPRGTKTSKPKDKKIPSMDSFATPVNNDPFGGGQSFAEEAEELSPPPDPFGGRTDPFGGQVEPSNAFIASPPNPFGESASSSEKVDVPDGLFGGEDQNPFSINDPHDPFNDSTNVLHKLPGAADDQAVLPAAPNFNMDHHTESGLGESTQLSSTGSLPPMTPASFGAGPSAPQPTGGFPSLGAPQATVPLPAAPPAAALQNPVGASFPQPTGGFPGFSASGTTNFPPVGGANIGLGQQMPNPSVPQPTGGFPGFTTPNPAGTPVSNAFPPLGATPGTGLPQPTGGFPGFTAPPTNTGMPQPTGGFPGFTAPETAPVTSGFPQPTAGFPGLTQNPPQAPVPPGPFQTTDNKKK